MSLINDALKRAKAAQATTPRTEEAIPHLRPVESAPSRFTGSGLVLPVALTAVALGGLFFLWQAGSNHTQAASPAPTPASPPAVGMSSTASPSVSEAPGRAETRSYPAPATAQSNAPAANAVPQVAAVGGATNVAQPAAPVVATPAPPRLQAIFYTRARPSAVISGKTVFVGDRVAGFQVAAITRESATLVGAGSTNLLSLDR